MKVISPAIESVPRNSQPGGKSGRRDDSNRTPAPAIYALTIERFRGITSLKWKPSRGVNAIIGGSDVGKTTIGGWPGRTPGAQMRLRLMLLSRSNFFLNREQAKVERVGNGTRQNPLRRELRMCGIEQNIPFAGRDDGWHKQRRLRFCFQPCISEPSTDATTTPPAGRERITPHDTSTCD